MIWSRRCRDARVLVAAARLLALNPGEPRLALERLCSETAAAFGRRPPRFRYRSLRGLLREYARYTRDRAHEALLAGSSRDSVRSNLYRAGLTMGRRYRTLLGVHTAEGALTATRLVYRCLGIDFVGFRSGRALFRRCSFARFYSAEVCELMSSMDSGLVAGLSGGGTLRFRARITEGACRCAARLEGLPA